MAYQQLDQVKRDRIEALLHAGHSQVEIAGVIRVDKSTISREIQRRKRQDGRYEATTAQHKASLKRANSKYQGMKIEGNPILRARIITGLKQQRSPDEIAGRLNRAAGRCVVNHKAIYKWLYSVYGERYCQYLCTKRHRKKRQNPAKQPRVTIPNLVSIHSVPAGLIQCEGDTFVSPRRYQTTASVAVVVERQSKLLVAEKLPSLKPAQMVKVMHKFKKRIGLSSVVLDRGIENRYHEHFGITAYFADPHSPWQKPLAENSIALGRRWFWPKGTNLAKLSNRELQKGIRVLNHKYRKSLGYRSAYEVAREIGILKKKTRETNTRSCG